MIGESLSEAQCQVKYAGEDADLDIAKIGVKESLNQNTAVIGEDTDLLILLLYYSTMSTPYKLYFRSDINNKNKRICQVHDIIKYKEVLGNYICEKLFVYSFTGCDTTSSFYGIGKGAALKYFIKSDDFQNIVSVES